MTREQHTVSTVHTTRGRSFFFSGSLRAVEFVIYGWFELTRLFWKASMTVWIESQHLLSELVVRQ